MKYKKPFNIIDTDESSTSEKDLLLLYTTLNHEYISQPFLSYVKNTMGWTSLQFSAICYLKKYKILSMSELADMMMITRQQATQLITSLVNRGHVEREYDPHNRRMVYVRPTKEAVDGLLYTEDVFIQAMLNVLDAEPPAHREAIISAMRIITTLLLKTDVNGDGILSIRADQKAVPENSNEECASSQ